MFFALLSCAYFKRLGDPTRMIICVTLGFEKIKTRYNFSGSGSEPTEATPGPYVTPWTIVGSGHWFPDLEVSYPTHGRPVWSVVGPIDHKSFHRIGSVGMYRKMSFGSTSNGYIF